MADDRTKVNAALEQLKRLGYSYNDDAQAIIEQCDLWYTNQETDFHTRKNLNGVEINAGESQEIFEGVLDILASNRFQVMYRKQLERLSASGTVGAYIRLEGAELLDNGHARGGEIKINYVNAAGIVPLTVENDDVIDCAFIGHNIQNGETIQVLVIFKRDNDTKRYRASTYLFDEAGKKIGDVQEVELGEVKPFAIMRTAEVNNLD